MDCTQWFRAKIYSGNIWFQVLCRNAVLVGYQDNQEAPKVAAFSRDTGEKQWELALPVAPVFNGLALSADGSMYMIGLDGEVVSIQ